MGIDGARVRARREELGLTQVQLAKSSGVGQSTIARIENGDVRKSSGETERKLAKALRTTVAQLSAEHDVDPEHWQKLTDELPRIQPPGDVVGDTAVGPVDETPLDAAIITVLRSSTEQFTMRDVHLASDVARKTYQYAPEGGDLLEVAINLLRAARAVNRSNEPPTLAAVLARWAYGKQDAKQRTVSDQRAREVNDDARARAIELGYGTPEEFPPLVDPKKERKE